MMPPVVQWLLESSTVVSLIPDGNGGLHVYRDELPERYKDVKNYVVWSLLDGAPPAYLGNAAGIDQGRYQFDCHDVSPARVDAIQRALVAVLEGQGTVTYNGTWRDVASRLYVSSFDVSIWSER